MNKSKTLSNRLRMTVLSLLLGSFAFSAQAQNIPTGSFIHGNLGQTLNVPLSGNPTAALIHLTGKGTTPNGSVISLANCDIYGKAVADQQSERISIIPVVLVCKNAKGNIQTTSVTGYVADQKGTEGLTGQFITLPTQTIATVNANTPLTVFFNQSFQFKQ